jgi:heat shock protein HslJ
MIPAAGKKNNLKGIFWNLTQTCIYYNYRSIKMHSRFREMCIGKAGLLVLLAAAVLVSSCTGGAKAKSSGAVFKDVQGREWILAEVKDASGTIRLDRQQLEASGLQGAYTLTFGEERLSGLGAPNRYFGPYTAGEAQALTIGNIAGTLMMGLTEVPGLSEHDYFAYLNKVTRWDIRGGALELYTSDEAGAERILIFTAN